MTGKSLNVLARLAKAAADGVSIGASQACPVFLNAPTLRAAALVSTLPAGGARAVGILIGHFVIHGIKQGGGDTVG
jgi:hypothetical protein